MRISVVDKDSNLLVTTKPSRARCWLKEGKAVKRWSDVGVFYVQLTCNPSNLHTQQVLVRIDPGKLYSGIGLQFPQFSLLMAHLVLPFKTVKKLMKQRLMMRRTRRARRIISRHVPFKLRNHRQKQFKNRRGPTRPPTIRANRELVLRVSKELAAIFPVSVMIWKYVRANVGRISRHQRARSETGFSPVMVGQCDMLQWLERTTPVVMLEDWEPVNLRCHLGLSNAKNKADQIPQSHAVDGIALAASEFEGPMVAWFLSIGSEKDLFKAARAGRQYVGWVSDDTARQVSISDLNWKRLGHFAASKVEFFNRNVNLLASGGIDGVACTKRIPHPPSTLFLPRLNHGLRAGYPQKRF